MAGECSFKKHSMQWTLDCLVPQIPILLLKALTVKEWHFKTNLSQSSFGQIVVLLPRCSGIGLGGGLQALKFYGHDFNIKNIFFF